MAEALALLGRDDEAAGVLADLKALPIPSVQLWMPEVLRAEAWVAAARGNTAEAAAQLEKAAAIANAAGEFVCESAALHDLVRLGAAAAPLARLAELAELVEGDFVGARAHHAEAIAAATPTRRRRVRAVRRFRRPAVGRRSGRRRRGGMAKSG